MSGGVAEMTTAAPPVRYSVSQPDFDYKIGARLLVRVDGVEQKEVVQYDCEAGTVLRNKLNADGKAQLAPDGKECWRETVTGKVTVEWRG